MQPELRACAHCNRLFSTSRYAARFCRRRCKEADHKARRAHARAVDRWRCRGCDGPHTDGLSLQARWHTECRPTKSRWDRLANPRVDNPPKLLDVPVVGVCAWCGAPFTSHHHTWHKRFCSRTCGYISLRADPAKPVRPFAKSNRLPSSQRGYGYEWQKLRLTVLAEEPQCRRCGADARDVDHILARALGGTDDRTNLQSLCRRCHASKTSRDARKVKHARAA